MSVLLLAVFCALPFGVAAHGRLIEPPSRASMWRYGFNTPPNFSDNQLFCGGFPRQQKNGGKCGLCGDPYDGDRAHETGGRYATGTIARTYTMGDIITIKVDITANHMGWFEFRLCRVDTPLRPATKACLDENLLEMTDNSGSRYVVPDSAAKIYTVSARLPAGLTCTNCLLQWRYHSGNSWGVDPVTKVGCSGCGPQEEFYGCADIAIKGSGTPIKPQDSETSKPGNGRCR